ncbi:catenin delta-2-like [Glandiceps talaboti]
MPEGHNGQDSTLMYAFRQASHDINSEPESAASILQSVKEQEAQFEKLTRELEAERQSVANQLEKVRLGSETASMSSISSTDESFQWRHSAQNESHLADESDTDSKMSGSQLVDSCLKVLQERGLMETSEDPLQAYQNEQYRMYQDPYGNPYYADPGHGGRYPASPAVNGPTSNHTHSPNSSHLSLHSNRSNPPPVAPKPQVRTCTYSGPFTPTYAATFDFADDGDRAPSTYSGSARSDDPQLTPAQKPIHTRPYHPGSVGSLPRSTDNYPISPASQPYTPNTPTRPPQPSNYHPQDNMRNYDDEPDYRNPPPVDDGRYGDEPPRSAGYGYGAPPPRSPHGSDYLSPPHDQPPASVPHDNYGYPDDRYRDPSPPGSDRYGTMPSTDRYGSQPHDDYGHPDDDSQYRTPSERSDPYQQMYHPSTPMQRAPLADMETPGSQDPIRRPPSPHDPTEPMRSEPRQRAPVAPGSDFDGPPGSRSSRGSVPSTLDRSRGDLRWRAPDLQEVIDYLSHPNNAIVANAAAYLQHLTFKDDNIKNKTRGLDGVSPLVNLLGHPIPEIHRSACGALRNISYGKQNEENKVAIKNSGGIPALIRLLRSTPDVDIRELVTGVLWNLSSSESLKKPIIDDGLAVMTNVVVIPESGWDRNVDEDTKPRDVPLSTVFRNTTGCLRNVSSSGPEARTKMRECEGLVDALMFVIRSAIGKNDMDNKAVENCMCILRNLSYRMPAEVRHPDNEMQGIANQPKQQNKNKKQQNTSCFGGGGSKQKKDQQQSKIQVDANNPPQRTEPAMGMELLWQPDVCRPYLSLLSECSNPDTLESAAGTIQNLTAADWRWAVYIRANVRKDKGLPVLVELLRMDSDRVVCAVSKALRNLSLDPRNKELIGKYAMRDLVFCLPGGPGEQAVKFTPTTTVAILNCLHEVILKNMENAKSLRDASGIEKLVTMSKVRDKYEPRIVKAANQVLVTLWAFKDLRVLYKKDGWNPGHFTPSARTSTRPTPNPVSATPSMGPYTGRQPTTSPGHGLEYDDSTLPPKSQNQGPVYLGQQAPTYDDRYGGADSDRYDDRAQGSYQEEIPMTDMSHPPNPNYSTLDSQASYNRGQPQSGSMHSMTREPQQQVDPREPVYAQVDRDKKSTRRRRDYEDPHETSTVPLDNGGQQGADSWV